MTWACRLRPRYRSEPGCARGWSRKAARDRAVGQGAAHRFDQRGAAGLGRGVDHRKVQNVSLVFLEQVEEEFVGFLHNLTDPGVRAVDFVHDDDDRQLLGQGLAQHEPGLGVGPPRRRPTAARRRPFPGRVPLRPEVRMSGVSMMLIVTSLPSAALCCTAVFFARIVMPFSRSRARESSTRFWTSCPIRKAPTATASRRPGLSCRDRREQRSRRCAGRFGWA